MIGRPTKLTPQMQAKIVQALTAGNTRTAAVAYANVDYQTFLNWMERGNNARSGLFFDFFEAVKKAEADAEVRNVAIIQKAAEKNWQAAAWWLERRKPDDWKNREELSVDLSRLSDEELIAIAAGHRRT